MGLVFLVIAGMILPWTIRNYRAFDRLVLLNTNAGFAFFWGNHPIHGYSFIPILPGADPSSGTPGYGDLIPNEVRGLSEPAMDAELMKRGFGFVLQDPVRYLVLSASRAVEYFKFWPTPESGLVSNLARVSSFGICLPFMVGGLILSIGRFRVGAPSGRARSGVEPRKREGRGGLTGFGPWLRGITVLPKIGALKVPMVIAQGLPWVSRHPSTGGLKGRTRSHNSVPRRPLQGRNYEEAVSVAPFRVESDAHSGMGPVLQKGQIGSLDHPGRVQTQPRSREGTLLLLALAGAYSLLHLLTWALVRYRIPVDALMILFAAVGMAGAYERLGHFLPILNIENTPHGLGRVSERDVI
jgi:hypothetical protein